MSGAALDHGLIEHPQSFFARLDPRTRVLAAIVLVAAIVSLHDLWLTGLALLIAVAALLLARLPFSALSHRLRHVEGFMIVLFLLLPFSLPGQPLLVIGPLTATQEGVMRAATIALKVNASVMVLFAFVASLEPVRLGRAFSDLGLPQVLVHLFLLMIRYIAVFQTERQRLMDAMRARGFVARSSWHTWRSLGNLVGMTLVRSLDRAERVREAMTCRAFSGRFALVSPIHFGGRDAAVGLAVVLVALGLLGAQYAP
jgi:cobalt/nickel transport system permease protein